MELNVKNSFFLSFSFFFLICIYIYFGVGESFGFSALFFELLMLSQAGLKGVKSFVGLGLK